MTDQDTSKFDLSVIIVTFNSASFIQFCIRSIYQNISKLSTQVIVIDNHSNDETVDIIKANFPEITLLVNSENSGFSVACNQGAGLAEGKLLLFLNPDCILGNEALQRMCAVMSQHDQAVVGPALYDGSAKLLPESARVRPTIAGAINKLLGSLSVSERGDWSGILEIKVQGA